MKSSKFDQFCEETTKKIVSLIECGKPLPWTKPWKSGRFSNPVTGTIYSGYNPLWLEIHNIANGYTSPFFLSFNNAKQLGGMVKKGEKSCLIGFFSPIEKEKKENGSPVLDENGKIVTKKFFVFKSFRVFNIEQIEGIDQEKFEKITDDQKEREVVKNDDVEKVFTTYIERENITIVFGGDRACYMPSVDSLKMPKQVDFKDDNFYYSTLVHEIAHSTGHPKRLNRDGVAKPTYFGSHQYSKEELVAEMTAAFAAGQFGFENENLTEQTAAYLRGWIKPLKNDPKMIYDAAKLAKKAFEYICEASVKENKKTA